MTDNVNIMIEKQIVEQCAPVILGIKPANLLILADSLCWYADRVFQDSELELYPLCSYEAKSYYLLFQPNKLYQYIHNEPNYTYLSELGYSFKENESILKIIAYKYSKYMQDKREFPHEIGLLLGYPLTDVQKFISYNGAEFLYSGYWKVYENLSEALCIFQRYRKAKEILNRFIMHGGMIETVIRETIKYE